MEVILKQDIENLGKAGTVVKVKEGFARNFLLPNKLAVPLTKDNLKRLEQEKQARIAHHEKAKKDSEAIKERLAALSLTITALAQEDDKLFGSISAQDIAQALKEEGLEIDKAFIALDEPIKSVGIYEIPVRLHPEVTAKVKVWIVKK